MPLIYTYLAPHGTRRKTRGQEVRYPFLVGALHPYCTRFIPALALPYGRDQLASSLVGAGREYRHYRIREAVHCRVQCNSVVRKVDACKKASFHTYVASQCRITSVQSVKPSVEPRHASLHGCVFFLTLAILSLNRRGARVAADARESGAQLDDQRLEQYSANFAYSHALFEIPQRLLGRLARRERVRIPNCAVMVCVTDLNGAAFSPPVLMGYSVLVLEPARLDAFRTYQSAEAYGCTARSAVMSAKAVVWAFARWGGALQPQSRPRVPVSVVSGGWRYCPFGVRGVCCGDGSSASVQGRSSGHPAVTRVSASFGTGCRES